MSKENTSPFDDVGEFHQKFGLPVTGPNRKAEMLSEEVFMYRLRFLQEELDEMVCAHQNDDLINFADALADLIWVAYGTSHFAGIPLDEVWSHVRRANMQKILAPPDATAHKRDSVYKETIRKPPDWVSPERAIGDALERWNEEAR